MKSAARVRIPLLCLTATWLLASCGSDIVQQGGSSQSPGAGEVLPQPPLVTSESITVEPGQDAVIDVLANDVSPSGETLFVLSAHSTQGQVELIDDGSLRYTTYADGGDVDTIDYVVSDGSTSAKGRVSVKVRKRNVAPVAAPDSANTAGGMVVVNVLANDADANGDELFLTRISSGTGTASMSHSGAISYSPPAGFSGVATVSYWVSDGSLESQGSLTITVETINSAPTVVESHLTINEDQSVSTNLLLFASDPDKDPLSITSAAASHGRIVFEPWGRLDYTPPADYSGNVTVSYTISDGTHSVSASLVISVIPVNDNPVALLDSVSVLENSRENSILPLVNDFDGDGDALTLLSASSAFGEARIVGDRIIYTPTAEFFGDDLIEYQVKDAGGLVASGSVMVYVEEVNSATVRLSWQAPQRRENGEPLSAADIARYEILLSRVDDAPLSREVITVSGGLSTSYMLTLHAVGTYQFQIASVDSDGVYSQLSDPVVMTVNF